MAIYGRCTGTVITNEIKNPENGKPHISIQVLQNPDISGQKAELNAFKDYDLNHKYELGSTFDAVCRMADWQFDNKSGQSATVIKQISNGAAGKVGAAAGKKDLT